jgi:dihydrodipicolinate synthase/N-acetylneuraminate lyase
MAIFKGTGVAIVTPMHEDGKVNFEKLEEILLWNNRRIFYSDTRRASSDN